MIRGVSIGGNYGGVRSAGCVGVAPSIAGEAIYTTGGTVQIPSGKTSIGVEAIGRGADGAAGGGFSGGAGGAGGGAVLSAVVVVPGEILTINLDSNAELRRGATVLIRAPAGGSADAAVPSLTHSGGAAGSAGITGGGGGGGANGSTGGSAGSSGSGGAGGGMTGVGTGNGGNGGTDGNGEPGQAPGGGGGGGTGLSSSLGGAGGAAALKIIWE